MENNPLGQGFVSVCVFFGRTCEGGELLQRLVDAQNRGSALTEKSVSEIMRQLMNALAYFHSKHVAHK